MNKRLFGMLIAICMLVMIVVVALTCLITLRITNATSTRDHEKLVHTKMEVVQCYTTYNQSITPIEVEEVTEEEIEEEMYYDALGELAVCVEAEAGNQDLIGKRLVISVILNRVDAEEFPNSIRDVIEQPYQFSSYWDGGMDRVYSVSDETFEAIQLELAERSNNQILYFTAGGYGKYGTPWSQVGDHYFSTR